MSYEYVLFPLTIFLMSLSIKAKQYFDTKLLPMITSIEEKETQSYATVAWMKVDNVRSRQSAAITLGNRMEKFWNIAIEDSKRATNELKNKKLKWTKKGHVSIEYIDKKGDLVTQNKQIDSYFAVSNDDGTMSFYYYEDKNNVEFDSEKEPESNAKILAVAKALGERDGRVVKHSYFIPTLLDVPDKVRRKYAKVGMNVIGVREMVELIQPPFTAEEFQEYGETIVAPIWCKLIDHVPVSKPAQRRLKSSLDLL